MIHYRYAPRITAVHQHTLRHLLSFWPLLLPLALLFPVLGAFPFPPAEGAYSDLAVSHYPYALFLKRALIADHALPLWSPGILSGHPFAANPLSGLWYPPDWLALVLPLPLGFNLLVAGHLLWGGIGMYRLLRLEGQGRQAALLGGVAFVALPKFFAHYGAGHLTLLYAVPWTPWLLCTVAGCRLRGDGIGLSREPSTFNLQPYTPSIILALIFFADPRWAFYAGVTWCFYGFAHSHTSLHQSVQAIFKTLLQCLFAALLVAPLALPLLELARFSTRSLLDASDVFTYSLPPARLLGLIFPDFGGFHEWVMYPGVLVFILALLGALWGRRGSSARFWLSAGFVSLLFSLGEHLPPLLVLGRLPGLDLLRVPPRALFLTGMALAALAAVAADRLLSSLAERPPLPSGPSRPNWKIVSSLLFQPPSSPAQTSSLILHPSTPPALSPRDLRLARLLLAALAAFGLALAFGIALLVGKLPLSFAWGTAFLAAGSAWILMGLRGGLSPRIWWAGVLILCCLDLLAVDRSLFIPRPVESVLAEGSPAAAYLESQAARDGKYRFYSPSYSLPQQTAAFYGLEAAGGVDPLQWSPYAVFMEGATGVSASGYSVALPPFAAGEPSTANAGFRPDPHRLGLLNVRYVLAEYDLTVDGLDLLRRFGETRLYENRFAKPRAWVQSADLAPGEGARAVEIASWTPNRMVLRVTDPSAPEPELLVLSELAYPGWRAAVDGQERQIRAAAGVLRAVRLEPGDREVVFEFRPARLTLGLALFSTGILFIAALKAAALHGRRQERHR